MVTGGVVVVVVVGGRVVVVGVGDEIETTEFCTLMLTEGEAYARPDDVKPVAFTLWVPSATVVEFQERL